MMIVRSNLRLAIVVAAWVVAACVSLVRAQEVEYQAVPMPSYRSTVTFARVPPPRMMAMVSATGEVRIDWSLVEEVLKTPGVAVQMLVYARLLKAARQGTYQQLP